MHVLETYLEKLYISIQSQSVIILILEMILADNQFVSLNKNGKVHIILENHMEKMDG